MTRRGVSLIELIVIMSAASAVLSTSAVILHRTMRSQEQTRYFFENERAAQRLARQFRADVRGAVSLKVTEGAVASVDSEGSAAAEPFLTLRLADSTGAGDDQGTTIDYRRTATGILRTATRDDEPTTREDYAVASMAQIELREEASPRRLVLTITADPADLHPKLGERTPTIRDTPVNMEAVAIVGRDARFVPKATDDADVSGTPEEGNAS